MNDLKDDARALFDIARSAHQPTSRDHERVLRGVLARGAIAAGVTSSSVGLAAAKGLLATSRVATTLKILAGFAILGATSAGAYRLSTTERPPSAVHAALASPAKQDNGQQVVRALENPAAVPVARAREQGQIAPPKARPSSSPGVGAEIVERTAREVAEPPASDDRVVARSPVTSLPSAPAPAATQSFASGGPAGAASGAPVGAATSAPASTVTLTREARALADVQRALREGRSTEALVMLAAQNREFALGVLGQEREAARIMALCAGGRLVEGRLAAERFLTENPGSPVATHVRSSCSVP